MYTYIQNNNNNNVNLFDLVSTEFYSYNLLKIYCYIIKILFLKFKYYIYVKYSYLLSYLSYLIVISLLYNLVSA